MATSKTGLSPSQEQDSTGVCNTWGTINRSRADSADLLIIRGNPSSWRAPFQRSPFKVSCYNTTGQTALKHWTYLQSYRINMVGHKYITRISVERGCLRGRGLQVPTAGLAEGFQEGGREGAPQIGRRLKDLNGFAFLTGCFVSIWRSRVCRRRWKWFR